MCVDDFYHRRTRKSVPNDRPFYFMPHYIYWQIIRHMCWLVGVSVCVFVCSFAWVNCTVLWRKRFTISCLHLFIASQQMAKMSQKMSSKKVAELVTGTFLEQNFHFVQKASLPILACVIVFNLRFAISNFPIFIFIAFSDSVDCLVANQFS